MKQVRNAGRDAQDPLQDPGDVGPPAAAAAAPIEPPPPAPPNLASADRGSSTSTRVAQSDDTPSPFSPPRVTVRDGDGRGALLEPDGPNESTPRPSRDPTQRLTFAASEERPSDATSNDHRASARVTIDDEDTIVPNRPRPEAVAAPGNPADPPRTPINQPTSTSTTAQLVAALESHDATNRTGQMGRLLLTSGK